jgi:hypothetical protein
MIKIGVVWFDDPTVAMNGWYSVDGSEPTRINSYGELKTDVIWITNINYRQYRKLNLTSSPHIFDEQYFRTSLRQISTEVGLQENPKELVIFASKVFTRVVALGKKHFDVDLSNPGYRYYSLVADRIMPSFMRKRPIESFGLDLIDGFKQSTQANQAITGLKAPQGSNIQSFVIPRASHAKWLLSQKYPGPGVWKELKKKDYSGVFGTEDGQEVKGTKAKVNQLIELGTSMAAIFRVKALSIDSFHRPFSTFAAGSNHTRKWATIPEILHMSRYSKVEIEGGYATEAVELDILSDLNLTDFDNQLDYSYSLGLFLENVWVALTNPLYGNGQFTSVGAYMRSYDRVICSKYAEMFSEYNYVIGSYGTGRVLVYVRPNENHVIGELALEKNLLPPMHMVNKK